MAVEESNTVPLTITLPADVHAELEYLTKLQKQQATRGPVEVEGVLALSLMPPLEPAVHWHQAAVASESAFPEPARRQALGPGYMRARRVLWRPPGLEGPLKGGHFRGALRGSDRHDRAARGEVVPGRWEC